MSVSSDNSESRTKKIVAVSVVTQLEYLPLTAAASICVHPLNWDKPIDFNTTSVGHCTETDIDINASIEHFIPSQDTNRNIYTKINF